MDKRCHKYCSCINKHTEHIKLVKDKPILDFTANIIVAFATGFKYDLRDPEYECLSCGKQS